MSKCYIKKTVYEEDVTGKAVKTVEKDLTNLFDSKTIARNYIEHQLMGGYISNYWSYTRIDKDTYRFIWYGLDMVTYQIKRVPEVAEI